MVCRWIVVLVVMLVASVTLAGCMDAQLEPGEDGGDDEDEGTTEKGGPRTGSLRGVVADGSFAPLEGAVVEIRGDEDFVEETTTLGNGSFVFLELEPGEYRLKFSASCCKDKARGAIIHPGQETTLSVSLDPRRSLEPFVETLDWEGFIGCSAAAPGYGVLFNPEGACADTDPNNDPIREFVLEPGIASVVVAVEWRQETTNPLNDLQVVMTKGPYLDTNLGNRFFTLDGASPLEAFVGPEGAESGENLYFDKIDEPWEVRFTVTASMSGNVVYQQPFTVYYHLYYWDPAPEGASAFPE